MTKVFNNIATFLAKSPEWVPEASKTENWMNTLVKKMSIRFKPNIDFPDFAVSFLNNLPIDHFNLSLKLNQTWYRECKRELKNRRKACNKKYYATVDSYIEAKIAHEKWWDDFDECFELGISDDHLPDMNKIENRYFGLYEKKKFVFKDLV